MTIDDLMRLFRRKPREDKDGPAEPLRSQYPSFWYVLAMHIDKATEGGIR